MYSIMVVEDSKPIVRDIIGKIQSIRPDIKEIVVTYDGVSALDMLKKQKPDILLTDIKMPMMDGLELISKAKEIYPELKCVVISGYGDFEFTHQALKLQVDEYILKPVDFEDFKRILQSLIYQIDQRRIVHQEEMFSNLLKGRAGIRIPGSSIIPEGFYNKNDEFGISACSLTENEFQSSIFHPHLPPADLGVYQ